MKRVPSSDDFMAFVAEVNIRRMPMVLNKRKQRLGGLYSYTQRQLGLIAAARRIHARYVQGDYHHYDNEMKQMNELGWWLLEEHRLNEGLAKAGLWSQFKTSTASALSARLPGTYAAYIWKIRHD